MLLFVDGITNTLEGVVRNFDNVTRDFDGLKFFYKFCCGKLDIVLVYFFDLLKLFVIGVVSHNL